jgi:hypothetical protein
MSAVLTYPTRLGTVPRAIHLAVRVDPRNPDHHLWNNHGTWWCHLTLHTASFTKHRVRRSLGTRNRTEAREIRDFLLATLPDPARPAGQPSTPSSQP